MNGLVLEGGAMRGLFTAGVLDNLMEKGVFFDGIVGVSAGACFGCNYKSHQKGRTVRYNKKYAKDPRYCSVRSLLKTGDMFEAKFCYHVLPDELDVFDRETFQSDPARFYVVASDVRTGEAVYKELHYMDRTDLEWIRASSSMPLVSNIVHLEGMRLLDGGITDSIPLAFMQDKGYDKNVVVLTKPVSYVKTPNKAMPYVRMKYREYPEFIRAMQNRHIMYNEEKEYILSEEKRGNAFVIAPDEPLPLGHICHDETLLQKAYDIGYEKAEEVYSELRRFLRMDH
ncbi:MAG: patatin family protein [Lachnospiraceae bacterium]|nr:patatin family protein [Lachnospiraceae bacterium]